EIIEHDVASMESALEEQEMLYRFQCATAALLRIEKLPSRVVGGDIEDPETRRHEGVGRHAERCAERCELADDFLPYLERRLVLGQLEIGAEQLDHGQVRRPAVRHATALQHEAVAHERRA